MPELLLDISRRISSGLTLTKSFESLSFIDKNPFTLGIEAGTLKMSSGMSFEDAFFHFKYFDSDILKRAFSIVNITEKLGGDISVSFRIASADISNEVSLKKSRMKTRISYVVLLYFSFVIFLFIFLVLIGPLKDMFFYDSNISFYLYYFNILKDAFYIQSLFLGLVSSKLVFNNFNSSVYFLYIFSTTVFISFNIVLYLFV